MPSAKSNKLKSFSNNYCNNNKSNNNRVNCYSINKYRNNKMKAQKIHLKKYHLTTANMKAQKRLRKYLCLKLSIRKKKNLNAASRRAVRVLRMKK